MTFAPGRQRREQGALLGELREEFSRTGRSLAPRGTEDVQSPRQSFRLGVNRGVNSITLAAKVKTGRAVWKPRSTAKAREGGDSRTKRSAGCSW
jgi:hypothetical protein